MFVVVTEEGENRRSMNNLSVQEVSIELYHGIITFWSAAEDDMREGARAVLFQRPRAARGNTISQC